VGKKKQTLEPRKKLIKATPGLLVFVLSNEGAPLIPCTSVKARRMLKKGIAYVVNLNPFTVRLKIVSDNPTYDKLTLGKDEGYKKIGVSVISKTKELLSIELTLDDKTKKRLDEKRMYRRNRRYRLRRRPSRFNNRRRSEGWLAPSIQRRFDTSTQFIEFLKNLMPISRVVIEIGNFDIQKLKNPDIKGVEYQQGSLYGFEDIEAYLRHREKNSCQVCGEKIHGEAHTHHFIERSKGGTDSVQNLCLVHTSCHDKIHKEKVKVVWKRAKSYKGATYMSIIQNKLKKNPSYKITYGWETHKKRRELGIEKSHVNDAFIIAGGSDQLRSSIAEVVQVRRNNRSLQKNKKGIGICVRKKRYKFQVGDYIWIDGMKYICGGTAVRGTMVYFFDEEKKKNIYYKKIERVYHTGSLVWTV
jgi:hypothetical protein